jgi:flagellar motor switch protein FliM
MGKDNRKSICIRLSRVEFECLLELANEDGETHTAKAAKLLIEALMDAQGETTEKKMEKSFSDLERKLTRTIFAMLTTVANHDEQARIEFRNRVQDILKKKGNT